MSEDLHIEPIGGVQVAALHCDCGMCGATILIEFEALDEEGMKVDPAHDFGECESCGTIYDAQAARFSAHLNPRSGGS